MKHVALVVSHLGSGSSNLCAVLDKNPRVQYCRSNMVLGHPDDLKVLTTYAHKLNNAAAIWLEQVLYNHMFTSKVLYPLCRFIYMVREPRATLTEIANMNRSLDDGWVRYYAYRLRRICEMAKRTPGALLLTWEDVATGRGLRLIEDFLNLKEPLTVEEGMFAVPKSSPFLTPAVLSRSQESYERHYYYLRKLPNLLRFEG